MAAREAHRGRAAHHLSPKGPFTVRLMSVTSLRSFIDQQDDDVALWMVLDDGVGHFLEQHGFAGPWWGNDESALALTDRRDQIDHPRVQFRRVRFELQAAVGMQWREVVEYHFLRQEIGLVVVDGFDTQEREITLVLLGRTNLTGNNCPGTQSEASNLATGEM